MTDICQRCISTEIMSFDKFIYFASNFRIPSGLFGDFYQHIFSCSLLTGDADRILENSFCSKPVFSHENHHFSSADGAYFPRFPSGRIPSFFLAAGKTSFADSETSFGKSSPPGPASGKKRFWAVQNDVTAAPVLIFSPWDEYLFKYST